MDKELTPKQQTSEAIRQAETILIMTGQKPNIDQVASTLALAAILRKYGKKVTAVVSDDVPSTAKFLPIDKLERTMGGLRDFIMQVDLSHAEVDKLKYTIENNKLNVHLTPFSGGFQQRDVSYSYGEYHFDLIIVLGVASYSRIDKVYAQSVDLLSNIPLINIDFHRINELYGAINLIEPTAASLAEILIAISESLQAGMIDETIATTMLTGLYAATDRFTGTHTTAKTMTVAAQMVAMGADQQKVVKNLYRQERQDKPERSERKPNPQPPRPERAQTVAMTESEPTQMTRSTSTERPSSQPTAQMVPESLVQPIEPSIPEAREAVPVAPAPEPAPAPVYEQTSAPVISLTPSSSATPSAASQIDLDPVPQPEAPLDYEVEPDIEEDYEPEALLAIPELPMVEEQPDQGADNQLAPSPEPESSVMEELLPPQHIELSAIDAPAAAATPEPLINDHSDQVKPVANPLATPPKAPNPTNNPIFAQRLDEFEY